MGALKLDKFPSVRWVMRRSMSDCRYENDKCCVMMMKWDRPLKFLEKICNSKVQQCRIPFPRQTPAHPLFSGRIRLFWMFHDGPALFTSPLMQIRCDIIVLHSRYFYILTLLMLVPCKEQINLVLLKTGWYELEVMGESVYTRILDRTNCDSSLKRH